MLNLADCSEGKSGTITGGNACEAGAEGKSGNTYGGGIYLEFGTFNMFGGNISNNHANSFGGGIMIYGEQNNITNMSMYGGTISQNSSGLGGGIYKRYGKLALHGGQIIGNTARSQGGGVYSFSYFTMDGGEISNNTVTYAGDKPSEFGAGGLSLSGSNNIISGGLIQGNKSANCPGGGIRVSRELIITGGKIIDNQAADAAGIYLKRISGSSTPPKLYLKGGEITGNIATAAGSGAGISADASDSNIHIYVSGAPKVSGNTKNNQPSNVYLPNDRVVEIEPGQSLADGAEIGITTQTAPTDDSAVQITGTTGFSADDAQYFFADDSQYHVQWNETGGYLELALKASQGGTEHTHDSLTFTELPALSGTLTEGSYYLTGDITLSDTVTISGTVNICLNGHKITGPSGGKPAFTVPSGATLNIYNAEGDGFAGLSGSGGIQVAGGGTLKLHKKDGTTLESYTPAAGSSGGTVTFSADGTVTTPGGGEDPTPGGPHATRHPALAHAKVINLGNFGTVTQENAPSDYSGVLPQELTAYRFLNQGQYYLENDFKMPYALIALGNTTFCLNGSNLGADNDTWIYEMQHVFWVPEQAALNVLDCQRDLHIVWLYGGRVFLKGGAQVNISGKLPDYITTIKMDDNTDGEVKVEYVNGDPVMTLPSGATLTQKVPGNPDQIITNRNGVLEVTGSVPDGKTTKITPPGTGDASINLKLPEPASTGGTSNIVLETPAGSTVQTGENGPEIKLEQPGEVASDGTVSSPKVTVTAADPAAHDEVTTTVTAPAGRNVQVDAAGQAQAPEGSTVTADDIVVKIEEIGGSGSGGTATVSPSGEIALPAGSEATASISQSDNASIVVAWPKDTGTTGTLRITDSGITPPPGSSVSAKTKEGVEIVIALPNPGGSGQPEVKFGDSGSLILPPGTGLTVQPKESVTIVIALPNPGDGGQPEIKFGGGGSLILPPGTKVTKDDKEETVTEGNNILDPESGDLNGPVNPNTPTGTPVEVTPDTPISTPDAKIEMNDQGDITVTPADPQKPPVVIKPQPQNPGDPPAQSPVVDDNGKVFLDEPFKLETEDGPDITAEKGGSVDPDGNVTGKTVTVEQKKPDGTPEHKTTLTAPEGDAIKVGPDGGAQVPVGTEVKQDDVTVKIDKVPDPTKPVPVKPDGGIDLPSGSKITITPEDPQQPYQKYTVTIPEQGGEVKPNPDKTITLPPGAKVVEQDGKETIISSGGGTIAPSTGEITGATPSGGGNSGGGSSGSGGSGGGSVSYIITASASIGGEISPDKQVTVSRGASQTFIIKPAEGYVISNVLVDGKGVGQVTRYTFSNVQSKHTIQALFVAEGMSGRGHQGNCPKDKTCPIWPYTDSIPTAWYHDGVHYCIETDLMIGTAPTLWEPDIPLTRAMMAQALYNKAGRPAVSGDGMFDDVDQGWYWSAITWGCRNNALYGYGDGNFGPQDPITREQLAALLWRYAGRPQTDVQSNFSDAAEVSDYAKQALCWASQHGIIAGYPDGAFRPRANATRAEAAQMIMRYFNL